MHDFTLGGRKSLILNKNPLCVLIYTHGVKSLKNNNKNLTHISTPIGGALMCATHRDLGSR